MRLAKLWLPVVVGLLVVAGIAYQFKLLQVKQVLVKTSGCVSADQVLSNTKLQNRFLLGIDRQQLENRLIHQYPCVQQLNLSWKFPNTLMLEIKPRTAIFQAINYHFDPFQSLTDLEATPSTGTALINWDQPVASDSTYLVDNQGMVFDRADNSSLPLIYIAQDQLQLGDRLDSHSWANIQAISQRLNELGVPLAIAKWQQQILLVLAPQKIAVPIDNYLRPLASLQLILQAAKIDGRVMNSVDLRFDKPVVVYAPQKR